jgi:hypothetical protein
MAIGRMLGYEYERVFKGSMTDLTEQFAHAYVTSGLAQVDEDEDEDEGDVFLQAAHALAQRCVARDDVLDQDKKLSSACLRAAAGAATLLSGVGDPEGDVESTEDRVARIVASDDTVGAARVVYALAWNFALDFFVGLNVPGIPRDEWLEAVRDALGPVDEVQTASWEQLVELFESRKSFTAENSSKFPIMLCRWVDLHLGDDWSDTPLATSALFVMNACHNFLQPFLATLTEMDLISQPAR